MFERNRIDNQAFEQKAGVPVEIVLADGEQLVGNILVSGGRSLYDTLNGSNAFLELQTYGEERTFIAKSALRSVKLVNVPTIGQLTGKLREIDGFDPAKVLGVQPGTPFAEVRSAYHRLVKAYHPDRFQNVELPTEVRDYLSALLGRINVAYGALEKAEEAKARVAARAFTPPKFADAKQARM